MVKSTIIEYYDALTANEMKQYLDETNGIVFAKVGGYQFWPARICRLQEWIQMIGHRKKNTQICVFFFGSHNYAWVVPAFIRQFTDAFVNKSSLKKGSNKSFLIGMEEAKQAIEQAHDSLNFWDQLHLEKDQLHNGKEKCEICSDFAGDGIKLICDGDHCVKEYHLACLDPPLSEVPDGKWFCPECKTNQTIVMKMGTSVKQVKDSNKKSCKRPYKKRVVDTEDDFTDAGFSSTSIEDTSEEKCLICSYGGELLVCEYPKCTKVYHRFCLGSYPVEHDEDAKWYCPRHTCAVTGSRDPLIDQMRTDNFTPGKCNGSTSADTEKQLWKCLRCPVAISNSAIPQRVYHNMRNLQTASTASLFSKKDRLFICPNCTLPKPKVQLAQILERIWSTVSTNKQSLPFVGPLMPGVERPRSIRKPIDLLQILMKIRTLKYNNSKDFFNDMDSMIRDAKTIIGKKSEPLIETADTALLIIAEQQYLNSRKIFEVELLIDQQKEDKGSGTSNYSDWKVPWRKECMPFGNTNFVRIEDQTIHEWTAYATTIPVVHHSNSSASPSNNQANRKRKRHDEMTPNYEGLDIAMALSALRAARPQFNDSLEYFLSPSNDEMEHLFIQQSLLLKRALDGNNAIRKAWRTSRLHMMEGPKGEMITLGEGRLASELRVANKNLRARLKNKNQLFLQLSDDHRDMSLRLNVMRSELSEKETEIALLRQQLEVYQTNDRPRRSRNRELNINTTVENCNHQEKSKLNNEGNSRTQTTPRGGTRSSPRRSSSNSR